MSLPQPNQNYPQTVQVTATSANEAAQKAAILTKVAALPLDVLKILDSKVSKVGIDAVAQKVRKFQNLL